MSFIGFSLSIAVNLFPAKTAAYTLYERHTRSKCEHKYRPQMQEFCIEIALHTDRLNWTFCNIPGNIYSLFPWHISLWPNCGFWSIVAFISESRLIKSVAFLNMTQKIERHSRPKVTIRPQWNVPCKHANNDEFYTISLSIVVDLFPAKIAGFTFMWTTYEIETWTHLSTVNARILHWNRSAHC